jgi:hypothetical protein
VQLAFRNSVVAEMNVCVLTYTEVFLTLKNVSHQFTYITYTMKYIVSYIHNVRALMLGVVCSYKTQIAGCQSTVSRRNITRNKGI